MGISNIGATDYLAQLQALLPQGQAWPRDADAALTQLLHAWADELARVDGRAADLVEEADPRTTAELLADWERVAGLPDPCVEALAGSQTTAQRRAGLAAKLTTIGGQSAAYYIALAASLGYVVSVTEFRPFTAGSSAGDALTNGDWIFAWQVNAPQDTIVEFAAGRSCAGEPLRAWGNELLECAISRLKPAHTHVLFAYG
jgi:uncharacterized protein YmfQ (DUF2313 family)